MNSTLNSLRISYRDVRDQLEQRRQASILRGERAVFACVAVVALSLMSAYVIVLRDAVRQGETLRASFSQKSPSRVMAAGNDGLWLATAPTGR